MTTPITFYVFRGESFEHEVRVDREIVKIGRLASAPLRLDDPAVSRMHAVVEVASADEVLIIDLGSAEGTLVNGARVNKAALTSGDEIQIGPFRVVVEIGSESTLRPPAAPIPAPPAPAPPPRRSPPRPAAPREMECPRCRGAIREVDQTGGGGVYRETAVRALRCVPCSLTFLDVAALASRIGRPDMRLSGSAADRGHTPTRAGCPACLATMNEVTLSWGGAWVVLEECPRCGMIALDEGEVEVMGQLADAGPGDEEASLRALRGASSLFERLGTRQQ